VNYQTTLENAHSLLTSRHPRAGYAHAVLSGVQRWSGADLQGKARRYGYGYHRQRNYAKWAWFEAGGLLLSIGPQGRIESAVYVGADDYGNAIYHTAAAVVVPRDRSVRCVTIPPTPRL
jgi:hypothetical protein